MTIADFDISNSRHLYTIVIPAPVLEMIKTNVSNFIRHGLFYMADPRRKTPFEPPGLHMSLHFGE